jgi:hypothetical protein
MLDKTSSVDVMLDPGNYVIDITLSGYAPCVRSSPPARVAK